MGSEYVGEAEVLSADAPLVIKRSLECGHNAAAARNVMAQLPALRFRERGDVRQDKDLEPVNVGGFEISIVNHLDGAARVCFARGARPPKMPAVNFLDYP